MDWKIANPLLSIGANPWVNADSMPGQRLRRWHGIEPALDSPESRIPLADTVATLPATAKTCDTRRVLEGIVNGRENICLPEFALL